MKSPSLYPAPARAGYTLFEIMLVLGIIAVLAGSAIFILVGNIDVAKEQRVESDVQAISMQLRTYEQLNYRKPSTAQGLEALVTRPPRRLYHQQQKGHDPLRPARARPDLHTDLDHAGPRR
jgi:general secretion pathway protein G